MTDDHPSHDDRGQGTGMRVRFLASTDWVPRTRHLVVEHARARGVPASFEPVIALLTTELVSNAVRYGPPGGRIDLSARRAPGGFDVVVHDDNHEAPHIKDAGPGAQGGRGLRLVELLSTAWGVRQHPADGKSVWFTVAV